MPETGGDPRQERDGMARLFKRRRQPARSRLSLQSDSRLTPEPGDMCQLGSTTADAKSSTATASVWNWLLGKWTKPRRRTHRMPSPHPDLNPRAQRPRPDLDRTGLSDRTGSSRSSKTGIDPTDRSLSSSSKRSSSPRDLPYRRSTLTTKNSLSRSSLSSTRISPRATDTSAIVPLSPRLSSESRSRRTDCDRRSRTRLQSNPPTLIQASTALQQNTVLQDSDTRLEERRTPRSRKRARPTRPQSRSLAIVLYAARMLILSIGVGVLAGTVLSAWNPATSPFWGEGNNTLKQANSFGGKVEQPLVATSQLSLAQELTTVKTAIQGVAQQYPTFTPGVFLIDLDTNYYMDWGGSTVFSAASTIKVPILIAFFQDVDAGKIRLDEKLTMRKELIATEAGDMQFLPVGAQFTALETITKMITISDNTATNMVIDRLGGIQALNQRFKSWGLTATQIVNLLPDLKGTNTTSPKELASLMVRVSQGELVSLRSRDRLLDIMRRTINNSQLPQGLGEGAIIAHKTGDISGVIGDVGLIDMPSGKRYATAVLVRRSPNDDAAYDLVQKLSRVMYQYFANAATPKRSTVPAPSVSPSPEPALDEVNTDAQFTPNDSPHTPEIGPTQAAQR